MARANLARSAIQSINAFTSETYLRTLSNRLHLCLTQSADFLSVEHLPRVQLDQPNALKNLYREQRIQSTREKTRFGACVAFTSVVTLIR